jgi:hypothetical protein
MFIKRKPADFTGMDGDPSVKITTQVNVLSPNFNGLFFVIMTGTGTSRN